MVARERRREGAGTKEGGKRGEREEKIGVEKEEVGRMGAALFKRGWGVSN